jgi:hypothetical protein
MEVLQYFSKIADAARERYNHPPTWAHIVLACIDHAQRYSSYGKEPILAELRSHLVRRTIATFSSPPELAGLTQEQLAAAARLIVAYERPLVVPRYLQDRVLSWLADYPTDVGDWTLNVWWDLLRTFQLTAAHFKGEGDWAKRAQSTATSGGIKDSAAPGWADELAGLVGLEGVKMEVRMLRDFLRVRQLRQRRGLPTQGLSLHQVFLGNPGTGKTTVARILAGVYQEVGVLPKGHLVEVDRGDLVGEYVGATEAKTADVIQRALGGVLFIDEAYSLTQGGPEDFGRRAIDKLVKMMEDYRDRLVVIVAGYTDDMRQFISANAGLASRFRRFMHFPDYEVEELIEIMGHIAKRESYTLPEDTLAAARLRLLELRNQQPKGFGNAREVRNLWETMQMHQASRLSHRHPDGDVPQSELLEMLPEDVRSIEQK